MRNVGLVAEEMEVGEGDLRMKTPTPTRTCGTAVAILCDGVLTGLVKESCKCRIAEP